MKTHKLLVSVDSEHDVPSWAIARGICAALNDESMLPAQVEVVDVNGESTVLSPASNRLYRNHVTHPFKED